MTQPEFQEKGEFLSLPRLFTSLAEFAVLHGEIVSPLSDNEGHSFVLENIEPLLVEGEQWRVTYIPPYQRDGGMVDLECRGDNEVVRYISLYRQHENDDERVITMVSLEPVDEDAMPNREVTLEEQLVANKAIANLFKGAAYKGAAVQEAEDRIGLMLSADREASPEDLLKISALERTLRVWFQK